MQETEQKQAHTPGPCSVGCQLQHQHVTVGDYLIRRRLIAAAPDLYEALRRFLLLNDSIDYELLEAEFGRIEFPESSGYLEGYLDRVVREPARAAIRKARGE